MGTNIQSEIAQSRAPQPIRSGSRGDFPIPPGVLVGMILAVGLVSALFVQDVFAQDGVTQEGDSGGKIASCRERKMSTSASSRADFSRSTT